jgi:hypothetical protein
VTEALEDAVWAAQEARAEEFRAQMFGDSRHPDFWETVRLFTTTHGRRAHVIDAAGISHRFDGVRVGDPFVTSACNMVWAFADDVSLEVDGVPMCERCAQTLLSDSPVPVGGES